MKMMTFRSNVEARSYTEGGDMIVEGYAIVVNEPGPFKIGDREYEEIITETALESADITDVVLNREHKDEYVVARTTNGTLTLTKDEKGLFIRAKLSQNTVSKELYSDIQSGLLNKMSFRAQFEAEEYVEGTDMTPQFRITKLGKVYDVSVVAHPWYPQTEISARSQYIENDKEVDMKDQKELIEEVIESQEIDYDILAEKVAEKMKEKEEVETTEQADEETEQTETEENTGGAEEMRVLQSQGNETNVEARSQFKKEMERTSFLASLGNIEARSRMNDIKERATAFGLDGLLDNHTPNSAGALIPDFLQGTIISKMKEMSTILTKVNISNIKGTLRFVMDKGTMKATFLADGQEIPTSTTDLETVQLAGNRVASLTYISNELLSASMDEMEAYIINELATSIAIAISEKVMVGTGTGEPTGALGFATDVTSKLGTGAKLYDQLVKVKGQLPAQIRMGATIYMNQEDYFDKYIGITDTTGQPIAGVSEDMFKGTRIEYDINVPKGTVLVADFSKYRLNFTEQTNVQYSDDFKFSQSVRTYRAEAVVAGSPTHKQAFVKFTLTV